MYRRAGMGINADMLWMAVTTSAIVKINTRVEDESAVSMADVTELAAMV